MEHETDVVTPGSTSTRPTDTDGLSERQLAFKRGAPAPRTKDAKPEPAVKAKPAARARVAAEPKTEPKSEAGAETDLKAEPKAAPRTRKVVEAPDGAASDGPATEPRPRTRQRAAAQPRTSAETAITTSEATADAGSSEGTPAGDGAPRRRSRGGRGRGGAGRSTSTDAATASPDGEATAEAAPKVTAESTQTSEGEGAPAADGTGTGPRKRRRRGGRGRGGGSRTTAAGGADATDDEREAAPDGERKSTSAPRARTRGPRPEAKANGTNGEVSSKTKDPKGAETKEPKARAPRSRAKPMSTEEQVESGGPTRGLRSTRSRTGRDGSRSRSRREPFVAPPRVTDKLMVITEHGDRDQIAVLEQDVLVQHYVTRTGAHSMVGNVYLGRVQNVLPGMEAAFVDIGRGRNGVLYAGEVNYSPEDLEGPAPRIEQVLKNGQAVMVQVTKDPMGGKGARVTAQISLPGRFLVFAPNQSLSGISRRLPDEERKRLKSIMKKIKPEGHGVIVRTAAEGASEEALTDDLARLVRQWDDIQKKAKKVKAPEVLSEEPELTVRVFRDLFVDEEYRELVTDSPRVYDKIMTYVRDIAPDLEPKVRLHQGKLPAFEEFRVVEQIHKALDKKVWLPSGGYLFIERTEAMTIIDVNTGKSVGKTNLEETVKNTNLEAASEVARQLRLRDIGGIIVIDFIDMLLEKNKKQVEDTMNDALAIDKTRSQVFEIGPLGLMQVTRKRVSGGLVESFSETCPTCEGRGILINYEA